MQDETPLSVARKFLDCLFNEESRHTLDLLCHPQMTFDGPGYHFADADSYKAAVSANDMGDASYKELHAFGDDRQACLVYEYSRGNLHSVMSQVFEVNHGRITAVRLIYDTNPFIAK